MITGVTKRIDLGNIYIKEKTMKYDIGMICITNHNIGNNFTNYALYSYLKDAGYSVVLIDCPKDSELSYDDRTSMFIENPYPEEALPDSASVLPDLFEWNDKCSFFIVASDQIFRYSFQSRTDYWGLLPWVRENKYKASYASSFGISYYEGDEADLSRAKRYFQRFHSLSVREKSGVSLLKNAFGLDAEYVVDPVFICDQMHFDRLASKGRRRLPKKEFVFAYILDDEPLKDEIIQNEANNWTNGEHVAMLEKT